jgi:uncharacterized repeat protein (TIGR01451 family)/uncharacterized protein (TIGR03382 family)
MGIREAVRAVMMLAAFSGTGTAIAAVTPQDAVLTLTQVTDPNAAVTSSTFVRFGDTADYVFTVTNTGPNHATGVALSKVVLPAAPANTNVFKLAGVTGATCKADSTGHIPLAADGTILGVGADGKATTTPAPCPVIADLTNDPGTATPPANEVTVDLTIEWALPDPDADNKVTLPVDNACPAANSMGSVGVEVASTSTPSPAVGTFPGVEVRPWADVAASLDGPANGSVGQNAVFTHTVVNHGPCPATNVIASFFPQINISTILSYVAGSATGVCASVDPIADGVCPIGDLAKGQTVTWTDTFKLVSLPESVTQTTIPYEFDAHSYAAGKQPGFSSSKVGVWDPATGNNTADAAGIRIGKEAGGCNSGGPGGLAAVALMAMAVFAARRRRTA